jgi:hypothetical protein
MHTTLGTAPLLTGRMGQYLAKIGSSYVSGGLTWNANWTLQNLATIDPFNSGDSAVPVQGSSACLSCAINTSGWRLVGAADFDGNGVPDLVYQYLSTGQVNVDYYGGAGGAKLIRWAVLNPGSSGSLVGAAADFNGNGVPDLVWQNTSTDQVNVNYYTFGCGYLYDDLARLSSVNCGTGNWAQNFSYIGNLSKSVPGGYHGQSFHR